MDGLFSSTCVFRQAGGEKGWAEVFQAVCAVTKTCCRLSDGGEWIPTSGGRKLNTDEKREETFSCRSVTVMSVWGTVFEIWLKQSRTSTCLRMWTDPSVYSAGNSTRTCWAFFLFLQQCKRGSGLREFPARLIQPQPAQPPKPIAPTRPMNFTLARKKINTLVKYWRTHGQSSAGLLFERGAYLLAQLQPRLLYDWLSNSEAKQPNRSPREP